MNPHARSKNNRAILTYLKEIFMRDVLKKNFFVMLFILKFYIKTNMVVKYKDVSMKYFTWK